jgi:hypothetical protein
MRRFGISALIAAFAVITLAGSASAQRETITGTIIKFGDARDPRTGTASFTLRINRQTSTAKSQRFISALQQGGQDRLLREIRDENAGSLSVGNRVARQVNVVREQMVDGKRKLLVVFERWMEFAELRGGYRSRDYPFGYMEIEIDPSSGKGEGKYLAASKIRWKRDKKSNSSQIEIEDYATYPAKLTAVRSDIRGRL